MRGNSSKALEGMARHFFRRILPPADRVTGNRFVSRLGPRLADPRLWYINRRAITLGLAVGVFFGLLVPTAQAPLAVTTAIFLRGNLAAAIAGTLVSNPLTFVPLYMLAYRIGAAVLQTPYDERWSAMLGVETHGFLAQLHSWWAAAAAAGKPLAVGLAFLAVAGAALAYLLVDLAWRSDARARYRQRAGRRRQARE